MRFLLRNAIRDQDLNRRRAANPSAVDRRPIIGGKPLPPAATRVLVLSDFTRALLDEIEHHHNVGNVQLLNVGMGGGVVDFAVLRAKLGFAQAATIPTPTPATPPVPSAPMATPAPTPAPRPEIPATNLPEETAPMALEELIEEEAPVEAKSVPYTETELLALKAAELKTIIVGLGGTVGSLKLKGDLVDAILALQAGE